MNVHVKVQTLADLHAELLVAQKAADEANDRVEALKASLEAAVAESALEMRRLQDKETGVINLVLDGFKVKHSVPKNVTWDTKKLMTVARTLHEQGQDPYAFMECKLTIPEKVYDTLSGDLRKMVLDARTEKRGKVKIELEKVE